eukprot:c42903_g1_i1.p2 GENE.c42903_g1_i1~~c42903_g1_i1.p2  ORF type:complete len:103 (-),score=10.81 c42903_g1_i1:17-325(-)
MDDTAATSEVIKEKTPNDRKKLLMDFVFVTCEEYSFDVVRLWLPYEILADTELGKRLIVTLYAPVWYENVAFGPTRLPMVMPQATRAATAAAISIKFKAILD